MILWLFLAFFIQETTQYGMITYENSWPILKTVEGERYRVDTWDKERTPELQNVELSFEIEGQRVKNVRLSDSFRTIYESSNQTMEKVDVWIKRREFQKALNGLNNIRSAYPYFPYLFVNYLYVFTETISENDAEQIILDAEQFVTLASDREQAIWYYRVYEFWRDHKSGSKKTEAVMALKRSHEKKPDPDKIRLIESLSGK